MRGGCGCVCAETRDRLVGLRISGSVVAGGGTSVSISASFFAARRRSRMARKMQAIWMSRRLTRGVVRKLRLESRKGIVGRLRGEHRIKTQY